MQDIKMKLFSVLNAEPYNPQIMIDSLKYFDNIKRAYSLLNSKKRSYNLEEHTLMVCNMFEKYFQRIAYPKEFGIRPFRLLLCLHDIGKPESLLENKKIMQHSYTINMIKDISDLLPLNEEEYMIAVALISDDPLGLYIRGKIELNDAIIRIKQMVEKSQIDKMEFMKLLFIYYQVDSTAYTKEGYIGDFKEFSEKPKLESVFQKDFKGNLVFSENKNRLIFSENIEKMINSLCISMRVE